MDLIKSLNTYSKGKNIISTQVLVVAVFVVVQLLIHAQLFATPWTAARQVSCPSPSPRVCSNSCPLSWWWHPSISSSVIPSSPTFSLSQHQDLFQWVSSSHQVAKVLELQHQSFQRIFRIDFLYDWLVWAPCSPRDSQESSPTLQFESISSEKINALVIYHLKYIT